MNRFSVLNPSVHYSHFDFSILSEADRNLLANTHTPGDRDVPRRPAPSRLRQSSYPTDFIADAYRNSSVDLWRLGSADLDTNAPPAFKPGLKFYLAFSALAALSLVVALDGTSISVALPVIADELDGTAMEAFWSGTSFLLSCTVFQPVYAGFSHIFGRKLLCLLAVTLFLVGTVVCALAQDMTLMLIGRTVQGAGGSGIIALTNVLITDLVPLRNRGNWVGVLGAVWALGSVSGPVIGGAFAAPSLWRWIFWLNVPFIAVSIVMVYFFIRLKTPSSSLVTKLKQADWLGSFMFVGSMTAILIPISWGGVQYEWLSWRVTVPLGAGIIGLVLTGFYELRFAAQPVLRFVVFSNRTTNIAYITTALHGMTLWVLLYYQPLYFEGVRGYSPILAGVALFPATFTVAPMAIVTGVAISKTGKFRWAVWGGWGLTTLGVAFLCAIDSETQLTQVILTDLIVGVGLGMLFPALQTQLQAASQPKNLAFAVSMFSFFRGLGQTLGIAIGGNIFQSRLEANLSKHTMFVDRAKDLAADATALVHWMKDAAPSAERDALRASYTKTLQSLYIMTAVVAAAAMIASFWVQHYDLDQAHNTDHGLEGDDASTSVSRYKDDKEMCVEARSDSTSTRRSKSTRRGEAYGMTGGEGGGRRSDGLAAASAQHLYHDTCKEMGVGGGSGGLLSDHSATASAHHLYHDTCKEMGVGGGSGGLLSDRSATASAHHLYHDTCKEMGGEGRDESAMKRSKSLRRQAYLS